MYKQRLALIFLMVFCSGASMAAPWPLEIIEHLDETKIVIYINESDIEQSPVWDPAQGAPAFGLAELLQRIERWDRETDGMAGARIEKIELKPILHHEKKGRWYYLVQLGRSQGRKHHHYLAVLMSGKAVAAIEEPASYK